MEVIRNNTNPDVYNLFVKLLDGKTLTLKLSSPIFLVDSIKDRLFENTKIPPRHQRLLTGLRNLNDGDSVVSSADHMFPTVHLLLRLVGGKGGFGSLLRGAATKAGQKKTNNFDACRDMSGRRLRHVNAEKKLEEWKADEQERKLEKVAEEFLKKQAKKGKKGVGDGEAQKYVAKYREMSERCSAEVVESVKEALKAAAKGKRKAVETEMAKAEAKKVKIWMGKRKVGEIDSDNDEDSSDDEEGREKSTVLNNGNQSDSSREAERTSGLVIVQKEDTELSGGRSCNSGSEESEIAVEEKVQSDDSPCNNSSNAEPVIEDEKIAEPVIEDEKIAEPVIEDEKISEQKALFQCLESDVSGNNDRETEDQCNGRFLADIADIGTSHISPSANLQATSPSSELDVGILCQEKTDVHEEKPLDLKVVNSATELEALGMDRLKSELQTRGLKCGGTLQERGARLFLLKTTPLDKLPKKLLAKK